MSDWSSDVCSSDLAATTDVPTGRGQHVATVAADVDAGTQLSASVVAHDPSRMTEVEVSPSSTGLAGPTRWERPMLLDDLSEDPFAAVVWIAVKDDEAACLAGPGGAVAGWPTLTTSPTPGTAA